ncbi:TetR/AcrR family transcriptional regulator [Actinoplanes derwentensis]|uniref:DNA-binding transcriptional regulator, AcrR family n=1 Tax=Actinoplanes derwentensis TaxID=113562 RepID=A0A1H2DBF4_9ACTN|nr:TetR/AcrR family transcriptional regulator [Actinoplanes derwentensis]GID90030.1 TetR family transcriptional regulator [Actinoplanes derwentensis]SDT80041.1 DNA-binding transcriptional regulator, AcrR family [Actinoplanes derwentensis]
MSPRADIRPDPETRRQILEAAGRLLTESPGGDVSIRAVCEIVGVKSPTIYHYFGDKNGLLDAVVEDGFRRYLQEKQQRLATGDLMTALRDGWTMHISFAVQNPAIYNLMYDDPQVRRTSPAAGAARQELETEMQRLAASHRLVLPVQQAADAMEAAAVGTALHLIRTGGSADDPVVTVVRDAMIAALFGTSATPADVPSAATALRAHLPDGPVPPLRASETGLLRDWLDQLAG